MALVDVMLLLICSLSSVESSDGMGRESHRAEVRQTASLEGVFMHKKAQKLKFLCERNDKVRERLYTLV